MKEHIQGSYREDVEKASNDMDKIFNNPNNSKLNDISMLDKCIEVLPKTDGKRIIFKFIEELPADMQKVRMEDIINTFWKKYINKYDFNKLSDAREIEDLIKPEILKENQDFAKQIFKSVLEPGELPLLNNAENVQELDKIIQEAEANGADYSQIYEGMKEIINCEAIKGNINSIEMFYSELEQIREEDKSSAISIFLIYASDELKEKNIEKILKHILIEKNISKRMI